MTNRTSSYKAQRAYDRMLADCSISSLRFLSEEYDKKLSYYKQNNDLNQIDNWREYKNMQQRKKMIDEELTTRIMNIKASPTNYKTEFDSTTGTLYINDELNNEHITRNIAFNEDESGYVISDDDGNVTEINGFYTEPSSNVKKKSLKDIYDGWEY